jgi:hypothetical protein
MTSVDDEDAYKTLKDAIEGIMLQEIDNINIKQKQSSGETGKSG